MKVRWLVSSLCREDSWLSATIEEIAAPVLGGGGVGLVSHLIHKSTTMVCFSGHLIVQSSIGDAPAPSLA